MANDKVIYETRTYTLSRRRKVQVNNPDGSKGYKWEGEPEQYQVRCEFQIDRIMHKLADKAAYSKSGKARGMHGAIVLKLTKA